MRIACLAFVLVASFGVVAPSSAASEPVPARYLNEVFADVQVTKDIVFGQAVNDKGENQILKLDLYQPADDSLTDRPVVVWAHGGAGTGGSKREDRAVSHSMAFAKRGWVVASVDYRLQSKFFPSQCNFHDFCNAVSPFVHLRIKEAQQDVQAAVRWFRANTETLRIHPEQIVTAGHSFGTVLALLANFEPDPFSTPVSPLLVPNTSNPGFGSHVAGAMATSGGMHEPLEIGPGEPPIIMWTNLLDPDGAFATSTMPCVVTMAAGNICDLNVIPASGHGVEAALSMPKTSAFFCEHVIKTCATKATSLNLGTTPSSGQITDPIEVEATLTSEGQPLADREILFKLGSASAVTATGSDGVARATITPAAPAGPADLIATFSEEDSFAGSTDTAAFDVAREGTVLTYEGATRATGENVLVAARLLEDDGPAIAGAPVTFEVNGTSTTVPTDDAGRAATTVAVPDHGRSQQVVVTYPGDGTYVDGRTSATVTWGGGGG
jgi:hypothetical protein